MKLGLKWTKIPSRRDPRWPFFFILTMYVTMGITLLGFNRSPTQVLFVVAATCLLDMLLHFFLRERSLLVPLSAAISGMGLGILVNCAHGLWLPMIPVVLTIVSKYV